MIAVVPLVIYLTGFLMTLAVPYITRKTNSHVLYFIGCSLVIAASGWAFALAEPLPGKDHKVSKYRGVDQHRGGQIYSAVNQPFLSVNLNFQATKESPIPSVIK